MDSDDAKLRKQLPRDIVIKIMSHLEENIRAECYNSKKYHNLHIPDEYINHVLERYNFTSCVDCSKLFMLKRGEVVFPEGAREPRSCVYCYALVCEDCRTEISGVSWDYCCMKCKWPKDICQQCGKSNCIPTAYCGDCETKVCMIVDGLCGVCYRYENSDDELSPEFNKIFAAVTSHRQDTK